MTTTNVRRGAAVAALVPLLAGLAGCGGSDRSETRATPTPQPCGVLPTADPGARLPNGFPALAGQVLYQPELLGRTKVVHGLLDGVTFLEVRDELVAKLRSAGYKIDGTDQEAVEAEAQFSGPLDGTIKVNLFCMGHVAVRYKFLG